MERVNKGSQSITFHPNDFTMHWAKPAFTPQPQSIPALWPVLSSRPADGRRLSWPWRLVTYRGDLSDRKTASHSTAHLVPRRINSLMYPTPLPLRQTANRDELSFCKKQVVKVIWQKAASPQHMDSSIVFAKWSQCAPPCNTCFTRPTWVHIPNGVSIIVQPFTSLAEVVNCTVMPLQPDTDIY